MLPVGFEPTISAGERSKTYALDRAATGTGSKIPPPPTNYQLNAPLLANTTTERTKIYALSALHC